MRVDNGDAPWQFVDMTSRGHDHQGAASQEPVEAVENALAYAASEQLTDAPGNGWMFASGALWALGATGHLTDADVRRFEARIRNLAPTPPEQA